MQNFTFLVVDDSYIDRLVSGMLIRHTLNAKDVFEVSSGEDALTWISGRNIKEENTLVILLDIMMPKMNGFEFLIRFDRLPASLKDRTTVLMLSSTLDQDDITQAKRHPYVKKFLGKPLSPNQLSEFLFEHFPGTTSW